MSDIVDMASEIEGEHAARAIARARASTIAAGEAGDCGECGHWMLRVVDGRCGFCRDGRLPPPDWVPPARPIATTKTTKEPTIMSGKSIMLPAAASNAIRAVEALARDLDLPLGQAAAQLIERGAAAKAAPTPAAALIDDVTTDALLDQVRARIVGAGVDASALESANARADAAERKLAAMRAALD